MRGYVHNTSGLSRVNIYRQSSICVLVVYTVLLWTRIPRRKSNAVSRSHCQRGKCTAACHDVHVGMAENVSTGVVAGGGMSLHTCELFDCLLFLMLQQRYRMMCVGDGRGWLILVFKQRITSNKNTWEYLYCGGINYLRTYVYTFPLTTVLNCCCAPWTCACPPSAEAILLYPYRSVFGFDDVLRGVQRRRAGSMGRDAPAVLCGL